MERFVIKGGARRLWIKSYDYARVGNIVNSGILKFLLHFSTFSSSADGFFQDFIYGHPPLGVLLEFKTSLQQ